MTKIVNTTTTTTTTATPSHMQQLTIHLLIFLTTLILVLFVIVFFWIHYQRTTNRRFLSMQDSFVSYLSGRTANTTGSERKNGLHLSHRLQPPQPTVIPRLLSVSASFPATKSNRTVEVANFSAYFQANSRDSNYGFGEEYEQLNRISRAELYTQERITTQHAKNRYMNITPYCHSIVKLKSTDESNSDYINANFIPGLHSETEYIATQAPLKGTIDDFYRMLLHHHSHLVVNLCERDNPVYFPTWTGSSDSFERMLDGVRTRVKLIEKVAYDGDQFEVNQIHFIQDSKVIHRVFQYHYKGWKDFGCPLDLTSLLQMIRVIHGNKEEYLNKPITVHCTAGVGRTGTFIAIDELWQMISVYFETKTTTEKRKRNIDFLRMPKSSLLAKLLHGERDKFSLNIFDLIYTMRKFRPHMVQTENQYAFIFECVNYILKNRITLTGSEPVRPVDTGDGQVEESPLIESRTITKL